MKEIQDENEKWKGKKRKKEHESVNVEKSHENYVELFTHNLHILNTIGIYSLHLNKIFILILN